MPVRGIDAPTVRRSGVRKRWAAARGGMRRTSWGSADRKYLLTATMGLAHVAGDRVAARILSSVHARCKARLAAGVGVFAGSARACVTVPADGRGALIAYRVSMV
jgi:hypothetical protein